MPALTPAPPVVPETQETPEPEPEQHLGQIETDSEVVAEVVSEMLVTVVPESASAAVAGTTPATAALAETVTLGVSPMEATSSAVVDGDFPSLDSQVFAPSGTLPPGQHSPGTYNAWADSKRKAKSEARTSRTTRCRRGRWTTSTRRPTTSTSC